MQVPQDRLVVIEIVGGRVCVVDWMVVLILHLIQPVSNDTKTGEDAGAATEQRSILFVATLGQSDFLGEVILRLNLILKPIAHFIFILIINVSN